MKGGLREALRAAGVSRETVLGFADEMRAIPPEGIERALESWICLSFGDFQKQFHNYVYEMVYSGVGSAEFSGRDTVRCAAR